MKVTYDQMLPIATSGSSLAMTDSWRECFALNYCKRQFYHNSMMLMNGERSLQSWVTSLEAGRQSQSSNSSDLRDREVVQRSCSIQCCQQWRESVEDLERTQKHHDQLHHSNLPISLLSQQMKRVNER